MSPITVKDWLEIANQRAIDAQAIHQHQLSSVGAVYMAGYAIECSLKALLQHQGIEYPKKGRQGHDLKNLWRSSPFQFSDLQDDRGTQTFFLEQWNTQILHQTLSTHIPQVDSAAKVFYLRGYNLYPVSILPSFVP